MRARRLTVSLALLLAAILAVGVNLLADRLFARARIDLTEQRLYTLSPGTAQILSGLTDTVTLRLYYSRRLGAAVPAYGAYADRVRAMLAEYAALAGGRLRVEVIDPEPFSEAEDRAISLGLQPVPIDQQGEQVFFGLAGFNLLDDERVIPFLQPERERFLEFDLTRLVFELSNPRRPVLAVLSSLPLDGDPRAMMMRMGGGQPFAAMLQLRQFFTVRTMESDAAAVPEDAQVLLVAHPPELPPATLYAIDQFVMRGGRLMVLVDPHSEGAAQRQAGSGRGTTDSRFDMLLTAWGIETPRDRVILDQRGAWRVRASPTDRVQAVDYLAWFNLQGESLNRTETATAELHQVTVASAGEVRLGSGSGLEMVRLLASSGRSMLVEAARVRSEPNPAQVLAEFRPDGEHRAILARFRGPLRSAFPGPPEGATPAEPHRAQSEGPANLVVGHDADWLEDRFWVRVQDFFGQQVPTPVADNGALLANLVETLAGGDALVSLRSRGEAFRPFGYLEEIRRDAEARFRQTERQLQQRLEQTERRLRELRSGPGGATVTAEQRAEIDRARAEILATRQQIRAVQLELRRDIERVETTVRVLNVVAVPAALTLLAIGLALFRARRRAAARG
jgi:ABC-type uncharacterized transport system involved in gliding motility auxiliary subunit